MILGAFWGMSPSLYKVMGSDMPATHIIVLTGIGVGLGLLLVGRLVTGRRRVDRRLVLYGLGCGALLNIPFSMQIMFSGKVPAAVLAIVFSTSPFFNYAIAIAARKDTVSGRRVLALATGLASGVLLVATRGSGLSGGVDVWTIASFSCPLIYAGYNWFTSTAWPEGVDVYQAGMAESFASALVALPFLFVLAGPGSGEAPRFVDYWPIGVLMAMWVVERIVYYTLIRDRGPVYTVQAIYVAAPAGIVYGILFFDERPDTWLWVSLALVMLALWLNNTQRLAGSDRRSGAVGGILDAPSAGD